MKAKTPNEDVGAVEFFSFSDVLCVVCFFCRVCCVFFGGCVVLELLGPLIREFQGRFRRFRGLNRFGWSFVGVVLKGSFKWG